VEDNVHFEFLTKSYRVPAAPTIPGDFTSEEKGSKFMCVWDVGGVKLCNRLLGLFGKPVGRLTGCPLVVF